MFPKCRAEAIHYGVQRRTLWANRFIRFLERSEKEINMTRIMWINNINNLIQQHSARQKHPKNQQIFRGPRQHHERLGGEMSEKILDNIGLIVFNFCYKSVPWITANQRSASKPLHYHSDDDGSPRGSAAQWSLKYWNNSKETKKGIYEIRSAVPNELGIIPISADIQLFIFRSAVRIELAYRFFLLFR